MPYTKTGAIQYTNQYAIENKRKEEVQKMWASVPRFSGYDSYSWRVSDEEVKEAGVQSGGYRQLIFKDVGY